MVLKQLKYQYFMLTNVILFSSKNKKVKELKERKIISFMRVA